MTFKELLTQAQKSDAESAEAILGLYKPLLLKESIVDSLFDEDLYQELCITLLHCLKTFRI